MEAWHIWKKASKAGAIVSAIVGPITYTILAEILGVNFWFASFLTIILCSILMMVISLYIDHKKNKVPSEAG